MYLYDHFVLPFGIGFIILFSVVGYKWVRWYSLLGAEQKELIRRGLFTRRTFEALKEVFCESLLHRRIWRTNRLLGYMHTSLAFGWFLLIFVGWLGTTWSLHGVMLLPHGHVFFKYFSPSIHDGTYFGFDFVMDLLLLFVLSGVALAWYKRMRSRALGMKRTTRHTFGDRAAMSALWLIFPARLMAESVTSGIAENSSFLTGGLGHLLQREAGVEMLMAVEPYVWLFYSTVLGIFFTAMPFSRYMHIFTEIPLIFLRRYGIHSGERASSFDNFQIEACSRCGICIDPCQLQADAGICDVQSVYFLRDRRYMKLNNEIADNCLMCGRCEEACPVKIELNTLRLNSREKLYNSSAESRFTWLPKPSAAGGVSEKVGYFAGCMTLLTPSTLKSMERIFAAAEEKVWWADRDGGVCCGRPLKLSGEIEAAHKMMRYNRDLFAAAGITTLVTSCPICLKVFREEYGMEGVEVLHHSEYIARLARQGRILLSKGESSFVYHDPCELGRGSGVYDAPREVIGLAGELREPSQTREKALCCGGSVANTQIDDTGQLAIAKSLGEIFAATGAATIVTACPLCKKSITRGAHRPVADLSDVVAGALVV